LCISFSTSLLARGLYFLALEAGFAVLFFATRFLALEAGFAVLFFATRFLGLAADLAAGFDFFALLIALGVLVVQRDDYL
jgi:hypothetical protein